LFFLNSKLEINAIFYDYDHNLKSNGYRSLLKIFDNCCRRTLIVICELNEKKTRVSSIFPAKLMNTNLKEVQTWARLLEKIEIVLQLSMDMQAMTLSAFKNEINARQSSSSNSADSAEVNGPTLFVHANEIANTQIERVLFDLATVHQEAFYGRACGFQFCDSLQIPLTGCAIALTSYNDSYEAFSTNKSSSSGSNGSPNSSGFDLNGSVRDSNTLNVSVNNNHTPPSVPGSFNTLTSSIGQAAMSVFSSTKYIMDPDLRSRKMSHIVKTANVEFCKAFWQLTETSIVQVFTFTNLKV
jgi:hypothetical protein